MENPLARQNALVMQDVDDELLVYDLQTDKAHCLNRSAVLIWKLCDGTNSIDDIVRRFEETDGARITEDFVWLALSQLHENRLLDSTLPPRFTGQSRRQALKTIGRASAVALPLVAALVVHPRSTGIPISCGGCTSPGACLTWTQCPSTTNCNPSAICAPS